MNSTLQTKLGGASLSSDLSDLVNPFLRTWCGIELDGRPVIAKLEEAGDWRENSLGVEIRSLDTDESYRFLIEGTQFAGWLYVMSCDAELDSCAYAVALRAMGKGSPLAVLSAMFTPDGLTVDLLTH